MVFLPRTDYSDQEKCREIIESVLLEENYHIYGWRQVPFNSNVSRQKLLNKVGQKLLKLCLKKMKF